MGLIRVTAGLATVGLPGILISGLAMVGLIRVTAGLATVGLVTRRIPGLPTVGLDTFTIGDIRATAGLLMDGDDIAGDTIGDTTGDTRGDTTGDIDGLDTRRMVGDTPDIIPIPATVPA